MVYKDGEAREGGGQGQGIRTCSNGQREKMIRFDNVPPEIVQAMCTPMHQILLPPPTQHLGNLWLGSFAAISDPDLLRKHRISHLVQVIDVPWLPPVNDPNMTVTRIDIMDIPSADLKSHLDDACARIEMSLAAGKNVLVHCQQVCFPFPPSNLPSSPSPLSGHLSQRFGRHCISHQKPRHVIRVRLCLCEEVQGLHQTQLWFRKVPQGMGDQTAATYKQVPDRVRTPSLPPPSPSHLTHQKIQGSPHAPLAGRGAPTRGSGLFDLHLDHIETLCIILVQRTSITSGQEHSLSCS